MGLPPSRCSSTIASTSLGLTRQYQILSGETLTVGPELHCPMQPLLWTVVPGGSLACRKASRTCAEPLRSHDWYWQTQTVLSSSGLSGSRFSGFGLSGFGLSSFGLSGFGLSESGKVFRSSFAFTILDCYTNLYITSF